MSLGKRIKETRQKKGISQKELAHRLGTSPQNLAQYENGKRNPKIETIQKIADALEVPVEDLQLSYSSELVKKGLEAINANSAVMTNMAVTGLSTTKEMRSALESNGYVLPEDKPLLQHYHELNETGQDKAIEQVELLTKIPEYRKDSAPPPQE